MNHFEDAFNHVVEVEGGYSDNPNDSGGKTNWGITEFVARANGFTGKMTDLKKADAKLIYKKQYWDISRLDDIAMISPEIAMELFDTGVNMGVTVAAKFLQRALNVLNLNASLYPDMTVDGLIGPMSVSALKLFVVKRAGGGINAMMKALNAQQGVRYIEIAENNPKNEDFTYGWISNRL